MKKIAILSLLALIISACQNNEKPGFKEGQQAVITGLETKAFESEALDTAAVRELTNAYLVYADSLVKDSLTPYYLSKAADLYKVRRATAGRAIELYQRVQRDYPEHKLAERSSFMIAFTYDELLGDKQNAQRYYAQFIAENPNHPLAPDAKALLALAQDTGLSDADLIKKWEQENAERNNNE